MTTAILLVACLALAGAVVALAAALRRLEARLVTLEARPLVERHPLGEEVAQQPSRNHVEAARDDVETGASAPSSTTGQSEFVITRLGQETGEPTPALEPRLFADIVLRESVVKAASWAYAVRRALAPANRNRIRFEMRREVKRARKDRKAEEREAIRQYRARRRAAAPDHAQEMNVA